MKLQLSVLSLAAALVAGGCKVGPDYKAPEPPAPAQWSSPLAGNVTNLPAADSAWWKSFRDDELDSLVARAAQSNLTLRAAAARVREARAARDITSAELWPSANASASYQRERVSANGFPPFPPGVPLDADIYQAGFDAAWELDVFGGKRRGVEASSATLAAAEYARQDVLVSLLGEVARNYVEARTFQRRLAIARANIRAQTDVLAITRERYQAGLTGELDAQQAAALLATTESQVPTLETGFAQAAHRLAVLLALPPGALLDELSGDPPPAVAAPPEVPVGLPSNLMQRRPDIRRAERELAAANARIGVAVADLFPKFSLTGDLGLQSISASDWFTGGSRFWSAGPTVQWRIFDAGHIRANIRVQNARQEQALAGYEIVVLNSMEEVENALTSYAREQTRRQSLAAAVQANEQALEISNQLYQNGLVDFLRVLDSQRAVFLSQEALVLSERDVSLDLVALYKALGGGWESFGPQAMK